MYEVNPYNPHFGISAGKTRDINFTKSSFSDLVKAQLNYQYAPLLNAIENQVKYADQEDPTYVAMDDMEGYEQYRSALIDAKNADHMADLKRGIDESIKRREIMYEHGFLANVAAGLFDPINLVALPFGGAGLARSIGSSALRVGAGVGTLQAGLELARLPFDPVGTWQESAFNIGAATVAGGILGGALGIPAARRAKALEATSKEINEFTEIIGELTADEAASIGSRETRQFSGVADEALDARAKSIPNEIGLIQKEIDRLQRSVKDGKDLPKKVLNEIAGRKKGIENLETDLVNVRKERSLRRIEDSRMESAARDPHRLAESWFTDSWVFNKLTPRPLIDSLQSGIPTSVKKMFVDLAGDKGFLMAMNKVGLTSGDSTYARAKIREGEWVQVFDQLIDNFGKSSGRGTAVFMDHNFNNMDGSFSKYLEEINRKYVNGIDGVDDLERESIKLMTNFWEKWEERLTRTGLIGNRKFMENMMMNKEFKLRQAFEKLDDIEAKEGVSFVEQRQKLRELRRQRNNLKEEESARGLTNKQLRLLNDTEAEIERLAKVPPTVTLNQRKAIDSLELRIARIEDELTELDLNLQSMRDDPTMPPNEENMFSRYWNKQAIADNRESFGKILFDWFKANPFVWEANPQARSIKRNLFELSDAEILRKYGDEFNVRKVVSGDKAREAIKNAHPKGALGMHQYIDLEKGIIYIDRQGVYAKYRKFKQSVKDKQQTIANMRKAAGDKPDLYNKAYFHHNMFMLNNSDSFRSFADYQDFVLLHELTHGKFKKRYKEDDIEYEMRVNDEALSRMKEIHKEMRTPPAQWVRNDLDDSDEAIQARVDAAIKNILDEDDPTSEVASFFGHGKSKHFRHRTLDIPNSLVYDYIVNDPIAVMKAYTARVAPRYEFANKHNGRSLDDILDDIEDDMLAQGRTMDEVNEQRKNYIVLYDRIVGSTLREPHSWDARFAQVMRDAAQLNYLGSAGFSTLPDMAKILMEHDGRTIVMLLKNIADQRVRMGAEEGRIAGQMLEILTGSSHMRLTEELSNSPFSSNTFDRVYTQNVDWFKNQYYKANLLAPFTRIFKQLDSMARCHTLVDYAVKVRNKTASPMEIAYLARYGFDAKKAAKIKQLADDGVIEQIDGGLYMPNTRNWPRELEELRDDFRSALNSGIENTILMGTPADKPVLVDGIFHIPMSIAGKLGLPEDSVVRGYHRIESPLLGMPFQFMSYSFAALNKITAAYATNQVKNRYTALVAAMGLGALSVYWKTPEFAREKFTTADWVSRSFDASGLAALYSDAFYTSMNTSLALGGPDIGMGIIPPKFPQKRDTLEGIIEPLGTGPAITHNFLRYGVGNFVQGEYGEGAKHMIRNLPAMRLWFLKEFMNETTRDIANMGRY